MDSTNDLTVKCKGVENGRDISLFLILLLCSEFQK